MRFQGICIGRGTVGGRLGRGIRRRRGKRESGLGFAIRQGGCLRDRLAVGAFERGQLLERVGADLRKMMAFVSPVSAPDKTATATR